MDKTLRTQRVNCDAEDSKVLDLVCSVPLGRSFLSHLVVDAEGGLVDERRCTLVYYYYYLAERLSAVIVTAAMSEAFTTLKRNMEPLLQALDT